MPSILLLLGTESVKMLDGLGASVGWTEQSKKYQLKRFKFVWKAFCPIVFFFVGACWDGAVDPKARNER